VFKDGNLSIGKKGEEIEIQHSHFQEFRTSNTNVKTKPSAVCLVTKKTATRDYVKMMEEQVQTKIPAKENEEFKTIVMPKYQLKLNSLEVPFAKSKFTYIGDYLTGHKEQNDGFVKDSSKIEEDLKKSGHEVPLKDVQRVHLTEFEPHVGKDKAKNKEVNMEMVEEAAKIAKKGMGKRYRNLIKNQKAQGTKDIDRVNSNHSDDHDNDETESFDERVKEQRQKFTESGEYCDEDLIKMEKLLIAHKEDLEEKTLESKAEGLLKYFKILRGVDDEENLMEKYPDLVDGAAKKKIIDAESLTFDDEAVLDMRNDLQEQGKEQATKDGSGTGTIAAASAVAAILFFL
jgi:hypothetical protein